MIILIDTEKELNKRHYSFMTKNIQQTRNRRNVSQNDKGLCVSQTLVVAIKYLREQLKVNQHFIWLTVLVAQWLLGLKDVSHCRSRTPCQGACGTMSSSAQAIRKPRD